MLDQSNLNTLIGNFKRKSPAYLAEKEIAEQVKTRIKAHLPHVGT